MTELVGSMQGHGALIQEAEHQKLDRLEKAMLARAPVVELPVQHHFFPGLYVREIFMPAGTFLTSRIHLTEHPYVVTRGSVSVLIPGVGVEHVGAGHFGVTMPGTRRVLYIHEDTVWRTFHVLVEGERGPEDLPAIEARIIERRELEPGRSAFEMYASQLACALVAGKWPVLPAAEPDAVAGQLDYGGAP